jgi:DDE superfamily endonuclease
MDESGARVGVVKWEEVVLHIDQKEIHTASPENRKSITIIEAVSADGTQPIPPAIICPGYRFMENWFHENLQGDELLMLSPTGYTNESLALDWLQHFIKHTNAGPDKPWKLLLLDGQKSHETPDFILKSLANNIEIMEYPSHMTHILQPLDVGVFRQWKHWHQKAIMVALRSFDLEYSISSFFRDLTTIRKNTFKPRTIRHAFRDAGMWPISFAIAQKAMRKFKPIEPEVEPSLPFLQRPINSYFDAQMALQEFEERVPALLSSSPTRNRFIKTCKGTKKLLARGSLHEMEMYNFKAAKDEEFKKKANSRKSIQTGGSFTATDALIKIKTKRMNEAKEDLRKAERILQDSNRRALLKHKREGINARKAERERLKMIKELQSNSDEAIDLQFFPPIRDPTKQPTDQELEALLPNPSLEQGVILARQRLAELEEKGLPTFTDLLIDPQILADEEARYPRTYIPIEETMAGQGGGQEEEEGIEDAMILGLSTANNGGLAGIDWEDTRSVVSDDSMNADFISFNC